MIEAYLATGNPHKCQEFVKIGPNISIKTIDGFSAEENGTTYSENAKIKLLALKNLLIAKGININNLLLFADDSGLEINAIKGELGLHTSRFMPDFSQEQKNAFIIEKLKSSNDRSAFYNCTIAYIYKNSDIKFTQSCFYGTISCSQSGVNGFGYDPIFIPKGQIKTLAELGDDFKNLHSHRALAFREMLDCVLKIN